MASPTEPQAARRYDHTAARIDREQLTAVLRLQALGADSFLADTLLPNMSDRLFGGQYLGNALGAAMLTAPGRRPHMLQLLFLRAGDLASPLLLKVRNLRDGQRFAHRQVELQQDGKLLATAQISLITPQRGPRHQHHRPPTVAPPEELADWAELATRHRERIGEQTALRILHKKSVLVKPLYGGAGLLHAAPQPTLGAWLKSAQPLPEDPCFHYAALSLLSDYWIAGVANALHTDSLFAADQAVASLNHSLWFHEEPRLDDWLLYLLDSPVAGNGLGLGRGALYERSGRLLATAVQEALLPAPPQD